MKNFNPEITEEEAITIIDTILHPKELDEEFKQRIIEFALRCKDRNKKPEEK